MKEINLTQPQLRALAIAVDFTINYLKYRLKEKDAQRNFDLCNSILDKLDKIPNNGPITDAKTIDKLFKAIDENDKIEKSIILTDDELDLSIRITRGKIGKLRNECVNEIYEKLIDTNKELLTKLTK